MKYIKHWLATMAMLLCSITASAHDFEVDGIYYRTTSITPSCETVEVTFKGETPNPSEYKYGGTVAIPSTVSYEAVAYSVTSIGDYAFAWCTNLSSVTIPESVTSIGDYAFSNCRSLTDITIPEGVTNIGDYAFYDCSSLTSVNIPENVTSIGNDAFNNCWSLTSITIPSSVTSIGDWAFRDCHSLTAITLPEGVTSIGLGVFWDCRSLTSITLPEGVKSIGDSAFTLCSGLTSITIPESVTSIGEGAFQHCRSLTDITCKATAPPTIESSTFYAVDKSVPVYVPAGSVEAYKTAAYWSEFTNYQSLSIASGICGENLTWTLTENHELIIEGAGAMYDYEQSGAPWYEYHDMISVITLTNEMTSIGDWAFYDCSSLTSITIPEGVTSIGNHAFSDCSSLTGITIPESVTSIKGWAFLYCSSLTSIIIPESVTNIEFGILMGCNGLLSVVVEEGNSVYDSRYSCNAIVETSSNTLIAGCNATVIPNNVTSIGNRAFGYCDFVTITIPEGVTSIEEYAFGQCGLTSITFPESMTSIGDYAFWHCEDLTDITILKISQLMSIGNNAFECCYDLTSITLPESVTSIGDDAFFGCDNLTAITCKATTPPTIESSTFYAIDKSVPVYVPAGSVEAYKTAAYWSRFSNITPIKLGSCATPTISYVDGKVSITCDTEGAKVITDVVAADAHKYEELEFILSATYTITAYATKEDYLDSDVTTVTLCWITCTEHHETDDEDGIITIPSQPVLISTQGGTITLTGLADGTDVAVYTTAGTQLGNATAVSGTATITTSLTTGNTAIVKIGDRPIKVMVK